MNSSAISRSFLNYFADQGHRVVPSAPLVPQDDPTLLFVNAGMVPFKNAFLGAEDPGFRRAVSVQKCLRVSGKHNDLENVGPSPRHHTFFEMLGNFSFGDYFKEEAIRFGWQLVTEIWGLPPERLIATVFEEDDEAATLWAKLSSLPEGRILRCAAADNFWAMGETGPCGPCSEIFVDTLPNEPEVGFDEGSDSGRYLEIWNLVFMQFDRQEGGKLEDLPDPSVDTGAGLERVSAVLQGVASNYDTDLFQPILAAAAELAGRRYGAGYGENSEEDTSLRVIADHLRAVTFLLSDGVIPSNEGRGYVLRRILRRAVRHGLRLGLEEPFLHRLIPVVEEALGGRYPQLEATRVATVASVQVEEEKFLSTLAAGAREFQADIDQLRRAGGSELSGERAFQLYDTFGMPLEVLREMAEEERFTLDEAGFEEHLEEQRRRSRQATGDGQKKALALGRILAGDGEATEFLGYDHSSLDGARVLRLAKLGERSPEGREDGGAGTAGVTAAVLGTGETGAAVLDRTVFYGEGGGQVGDVGSLTWDGGSARITDTQKTGSGVILHFLQVEAGSLEAGEEVAQSLADDRRRSVERNHTATHLLHAALRDVLGEGVRQAGSLVAPDRLRFDFTHGKPLEAGKVRRVEDLVNRWILKDVDTRFEVRDHADAVAAGAMALFGEKYGDRVRTVEIPDFSLELCGGCHVGGTGEIGVFLVTAERGIASGVRRIEAVTGEGALARTREQAERLAAVEGALGVPAERAAVEIEGLKGQLKEKDAELSKLRLQLVAGAGAGSSGAGDDTLEVQGIHLLVRQVPPAPTGELRNMADALKSKLGSGVVVLGSGEPGKASFIVAVSEDLIRGDEALHAGRLVKALAAEVGGGGGGRPDFAQAGGKDFDGLPAALDKAPELLRAQLQST